LERVKSLEAAKKLKEKVLLTGDQQATDHELCLLRRMWILLDLVLSQEHGP